MLTCCRSRRDSRRRGLLRRWGSARRGARCRSRCCAAHPTRSSGDRARRCCVLFCRPQKARSPRPRAHSNEMRKDLEPRLARTGDQALLEPFLEFFKDKPLSNGSTILSIWESACPSAVQKLASTLAHPACLQQACARRSRAACWQATTLRWRGPCFRQASRTTSMRMCPWAWSTRTSAAPCLTCTGAPTASCPTRGGSGRTLPWSCSSRRQLCVAAGGAA